MNVEEFLETVQRLDPDNFGAWPLLIKVLVWFVAFLLAIGLMYQYQVSNSLSSLNKKKSEEVELMESYEQKAFAAANLDLLKKQMSDMEISFGALVRQLPSDTEVPGLVEDISQLGVDSGLELKAIDLGSEKVIEFYAELPIQITVVGNYHALGNFVSGIAALPRIVTLHDFSITPVKEEKPGLLALSIMAKTYRYNDRDQED